MTDPGAGDLGRVVGLILSVAALLGGAIAWLASRRDRSADRQEQAGSIRERKLERWSDELAARETKLLASQEAFQARIDRHMAEQDAKIEALEVELEKHRVATPALFARLAHHDPKDPVLAQVAQLLGAGLPLTPTDFDGALDELVRRLPT